MYNLWLEAIFSRTIYFTELFCWLPCVPGHHFQDESSCVIMQMFISENVYIFNEFVRWSPSVNYAGHVDAHYVH